MKKVFTVLLMSMYITLGWAQWDGSVATEFAGGDGSEATPYEISTPAQLAYLENYSRSVNPKATGEYFKLTSDIDLSGDSDWIPIGGWGYSFEGHFDGDGHVVSNMSVSYTDKWYVGLFAVVYNGSIKNVGVKDYSITYGGSGNADVGGLVGLASQLTSIEGCFTKGTINLLNVTDGYGAAAKEIGGLAGCIQFGSTVTNCYTISDVTVQADASSTQPITTTGVFVGYNKNSNSSISNCYSYGTATVIAASGDETNEYFCGSVDGSISNCYMNESSASGTNTGVTKVSDTYFKSMDMVSALDPSAWHQDADETINNGLPVLAWQGGTAMEFATVAVTTDGNGIVMGAGTYLPGETVELIAVADYGYTFAGWTGDITSSDHELVIEEIQESITLTAKFEVSSTVATTDWDGTTITSVADLIAFTEAAAEGNSFEGVTVTLNSDLVMDNSMSWKAIGYSPGFAGTFDGNGHTIQGLRIYNNAWYQGLFGYVSGTIKNLGLIDADVMAGSTGKSAILVGGLSGENALVENCFVSGEFGMLSTGTDVGSVAGRVDNGGTVKNCYSLANVTATGGGTGGVVGTVEANSLVSSCYFVGHVSSPDGYPAIVGYVGGTVENCYFDTEVTGISAAANGTTASATSDMKAATMVDNLNNGVTPAVWSQDVNSTINNGYPILAWQEGVNTDVPSISKNDELIVYQSGSSLLVKNAQAAHTLKVFSITGAIFKTFTVTNSQMSIDIPAGIWIITNGNSVKKIVVR